MLESILFFAVPLEGSVRGSDNTWNIVRRDVMAKNINTRKRGEDVLFCAHSHH